MPIRKHYLNIMGLFLWLVPGWTHAQDLISTVGGTLTVDHENTTNSAESSPYVVDGDATTKFLLYNFSSVTMVYAFTSAVKVDRYALTSANDASTRDPKDWAFSASTDGSTWTTLDTKTGETFANRQQTNYYTVANNTSYNYYRLIISKNNGATLMQMAEWWMFQTEAPTAPSDFIALAASNTAVYLEWTDNDAAGASNEEVFLLERSADGTSFSLLDSVAADVVFYDDVDLDPGQTYSYRIRSTNAAGASSYSDVASVTTLNEPGQAFDVTDDGGVLVSTGAESSPDLLEYLIDNDFSTKYLSASPAFPVIMTYAATTIIPLKITNYTITSGNDAEDRDPKNWTLEASEDSTSWTVLDTQTDFDFPLRSQTYRFVIADADPENYRFFRLNVSEDAGSADFQIMEWEIIAIPTDAPAIPTELVVADSTYQTLTLEWSDNSANETAFLIERSADGITFSQVGSAGADETSFTDEGLTSYTVYYYRIRAVNADSYSMYSETISGMTGANPYYPFAPENVVANTAGDDSITLTWTDVSEVETGFEIQRSGDGVTFAVIDSVEADVETFEDVDLLKGTTYYYRLYAYSDLGRSDLPSNTASATTSGHNMEPSFDPIPDQYICAIDTTYRISITGITAGEGESGQTYRFSVSAEPAELFESLVVTQTELDTTYLSYEAATKDIPSAVVTVTITDDGGTNNGGIDTYSQSFVLTTDLSEVDITSDVENDVPRGTTLTLTADGADTYVWNMGPGILSALDQAAISVKPTQDYLYEVVGTSLYGCHFSQTYLMTMAGDHVPEVNNILTPNGDGYNDVWQVWNINTYIDNQLKVYNTAGQVVYQQSNYDNTWTGQSHGKKLPAGVYFYVIDLGSGLTPLRGSLTIIY